MGLDIVIIATEEIFDLDIQVADAQKINTVGSLVDLVESRIGNNETPIWRAKILYSETLAKLKAELAPLLGVCEDEIQPETKLKTLIPPKSRLAVWQVSPMLANSGKLQPTTLSCLLMIIFLPLLYVILPIFYVVIFFAGKSGVLRSIGLLGIPFFTALLLLWKNLMGFFARFGNGLPIDTIDDVVRRNLSKMGVRLNRENEYWTREQIEHEIRTMIAQAAGLSYEKVTLEKELVADLGLG